MNDTEREQLPLFDSQPYTTEDDKTAKPADMPLKADSEFSRALEVYLDALQLGGFSPYTVKAFRSDMGLLGSWAGKDKPIGSIGTADLSKFLHWLQFERGVPCSPKSYSRRVTALKNFFGYLHQMRVIPSDPSAALIQQSAGSPLPEVLAEDEIAQVLDVTATLRAAARPDARPHLLVTLLLNTGIKKGECMALRPADIDRSDPSAPFVWVRYVNPRMRYKERKIALPADWLELLDEYLAQRQPKREIFDCTARNLEYVLRDIAERIPLSQRKLSFEALRWTCALREWRTGSDRDKLRQKLGLSRIAWRETSARLSE